MGSASSCGRGVDCRNYGLGNREVFGWEIEEGWLELECCVREGRKVGVVGRWEGESELVVYGLYENRSKINYLFYN